MACHFRTTIYRFGIHLHEGCHTDSQFDAPATYIWFPIATTLMSPDKTIRAIASAI